MYVRVKKVGSKRYAYLVQGTSKNGRVRQETLAYLGPVSKIALGVSGETRKKVNRKIGNVDWDEINMNIRKIPLELGELKSMRRHQLTTVFSVRQGLPRDGRGAMPRVQGELTALAMIAERGFNEMFEPLGERVYRMRIR